MACASKVEGNIRTFDIDYFCENPFEYAFIVTKIKEKLKISVEGELNVDVGDKWLIMAMSNNGKETIQLANVIGNINDTPRKKINDYIDIKKTRCPLFDGVYTELSQRQTNYEPDMGPTIFP